MNHNLRNMAGRTQDKYRNNQCIRLRPLRLKREEAGEPIVSISCSFSYSCLTRIVPNYSAFRKRNDCQNLPHVLTVRLAVYAGLQKWDLMQMVARRLTRHDPASVQWKTSLSNCVILRESANGPISRSIS